MADIGDFFSGLVAGGLKMLGNAQQRSDQQAAALQQQQAQSQQQIIAQNFNRQAAQEAMGFSAEQADVARQFSAQQQTQAETFNASQAELNRQFQERMSSTAYQRSRQDMAAAGLNPILAAGAGGSSTPGGGQGSVGAVTGPAASGISASVGVGGMSRADVANRMEGVIASAAELARLKPSIDSIRAQTDLTAERQLTQASETDYNRKAIAAKHQEIEESKARQSQIEKQTRTMGSQVGPVNLEGILEFLGLRMPKPSQESRSPGMGAGSVDPRVTEGPGTSASAVDRFLGSLNRGLDPFNVFSGRGR